MKNIKKEKMSNNDIIRRLRYALDLSDKALADIFNLGGYKISQEELKSIFKRDGEEGYVELSNEKMDMFLDGFITYRRGKKESKPGQPEPKKEALNNNVIFKKLRIALALRGEDVLEIMKLSDKKISSSELSAIFRKKGHRNYKSCGDRYIRNFLKGLTIKYRG